MRFPRRSLLPRHRRRLATRRAGASRPLLGPRFCAQLRGGGENCGYYTFNQCLASVSGVGGFCYIAPIQIQVRRRADAARPARAYRDAID